MTARFARAAAVLGAAVLLLGACTDAATTPSPAAATSPSPGARSPSPVGTAAPAWRRIADAPTRRQEVAAAVLDGKVWVAGGFVDGRSSRLVEIYDPATDSWSAGPSLPLGVDHAMAATLGDAVVVFGGNSSGRPSDRVFLLEGGRWREGPRLRRARAAAAAATVGGRIVVAGGIGPGDHVAPVEIFDGTAWRDGAGIPTLRDHLAVATDGRFLYAAGGRRSGEHLDTFERYDPSTDRWTTLPDVPTARSGFGAAFAGGRVVTVGGEGPRIFPEVEAYDVSAGRWTRLPDMLVPRHGVGVAALGTKVFSLVGGDRVGGAASAASEVVDLG